MICKRQRTRTPTGRLENIIYKSKLSKNKYTNKFWTNLKLILIYIIGRVYSGSGGLETLNPNRLVVLDLAQNLDMLGLKMLNPNPKKGRVGGAFKIVLNPYAHS